MITNRKLKIYTIDGSMYCAKNECNTLITVPRRHKHPSSGANRPSDIGVTVNINAEFNLMALNPIIECFSRDLVTEYCQGLESSTVYTAPPLFVETHPGRSNWSLHHLPLLLHEHAIFPTFVLSKIYIGQCLPKALTLTRLWLYKMFKVLLIARTNKSVRLWEILNLRLQRDVFPYWLARVIPLKERVQ